MSVEAQYYNPISPCTEEQLQLLVNELSANAQKLLTESPDIPFTHFMQFSLEETQLGNPQHDKKTLNALEDKLLQSIQSILKNCRHLPGPNKFTVNNEIAVILHAQQLPFRSEYVIPAENLCQPRVAIIGAGLAGLLTALVLGKAGIHITIFEGRSSLDSRLRPQNISFKEAELRLKPLLGDTTYAKFFGHGGSLDGSSGKLRVSTGVFQDVLTEALAERGIYVQYEHQVSYEELQEFQEYDGIIVTTGVHTCERLSLNDYFNPVSFPEYAAQGHTALCICESSEAHGYQRNNREGYHWRRDNISIYPGKTMERDLQRMIRNIENTTANQTMINHLRQLIQCKTIEYSFIFGNDTEGFFTDFPREPEGYVIQENTFHITPMIALTPITKLGDTPLVAVGDANGSAHPLAAIGTLKFLRNVTHLQHFLYSRKLLAMMREKLDYARASEDLARCEELLMTMYSHKAFINTKEVFFGNILSCIFSGRR